MTELIDLEKEKNNRYAYAFLRYKLENKKRKKFKFYLNIHDVIDHLLNDHFTIQNAQFALSKAIHEGMIEKVYVTECEECSSYNEITVNESLRGWTGGCHFCKNTLSFNRNRVDALYRITDSYLIEGESMSFKDSFIESVEEDRERQETSFQRLVKFLNVLG